MNREHSLALNSKTINSAVISSIRGNVGDEVKQAALSGFNYFVSTPGKSFAAEVGQRLRMDEITTWGEGGSSYAQTIFKGTVTRDMCNVFNTMHGACAAFIVDPCSVSALVVLGILNGFDGFGMSQSMHLIWHGALPCGTNIKIVSRAMSTRARVRTMQCEIWNADTNTLCISAVHSTMSVNKKAKKSNNDVKL